MNLPKKSKFFGGAIPEPPNVGGGNGSVHPCLATGLEGRHVGRSFLLHCVQYRHFLQTKKWT